jgi:hypothetical protein
MGARRCAYRALVGKPEGNRKLGRPRHRWEDNIIMDLQDLGWGERAGLMWLRTGTVHVVMNSKFQKMWEFD